MGTSGKHHLQASMLVLVALIAALIAALPVTVRGTGDGREYVQFNPGLSLTDNLTALKGKAATIHLADGQSMTGVVKEVRDTMLHLERLSGKEFYDALIRIDAITAVEARVR